MASGRPEEDSAVAGITVHYWAAAREAAGCTSEEVDADTLAGLISQAGERHGAALARLLESCSFLVDGAPAKRSDAAHVVLDAGAVVEVLPPFAGG